MNHVKWTVYKELNLLYYVPLVTVMEDKCEHNEWFERQEE